MAIIYDVISDKPLKVISKETQEKIDKLTDDYIRELRKLGLEEHGNYVYCLKNTIYYELYYYKEVNGRPTIGLLKESI